MLFEHQLLSLTLQSICFLHGRAIGWGRKVEAGLCAMSTPTVLEAKSYINKVTLASTHSSFGPKMLWVGKYSSWAGVEGGVGCLARAV